MKSKKNKNIKIIIGAVILIIAVVILLFMLFLKKNNEEEKVIKKLKEYENQIGSLDNLKYTESYDNNYTFMQYHKGVEVYGGTLITIMNDEKISKILDYKYNIPEDFSIKPTSKKEDLLNVAKEYFNSDNGNLDFKLIIYPLNDKEFTLAHYVSNNGRVVILKDGSNEVISKSSTIYSSNEIDPELEAYLENFKIQDNEYRLYDKKRNIEVYKMKNNYSSTHIKGEDYLQNNNDYYDRITWKNAKEANKKYTPEINAIKTIGKVYDYYQKVFGFKSINFHDGFKLSVYTNLNKVKEEGEKDFNDYSSNAFLAYWNENDMRIYFGSNNEYNDDLEVAAHEYTHGYFRGIVKPEGTSNKISAINEGYADIMAQIVEAYYANNKQIDGVLSSVRNVKDSTLKMSNFKFSMSGHDASFIVSKVAYLMSINEKLNLSLNDLANIWFKSLYKLPKNIVIFEEVELAVLMEALELGFDEEQIKEMAKSFTEVGYPDLTHLVLTDSVICRYDGNDDSNSNENSNETVSKKDTLELGVYTNSDESALIALRENNECEVMTNEHEALFDACTYEIKPKNDNSNEYNIIFKHSGFEDIYYTIDNEKKMSNANNTLEWTDVNVSKKTLKAGTYKMDNMPGYELTITLNEDNTCHYKGVSDSDPFSNYDEDCNYRYQRYIYYGSLEDFIVLELKNGKTESFQVQDSENMNSQWLLLKYIN